MKRRIPVIVIVSLIFLVPGWVAAAHLAAVTKLGKELEGIQTRKSWSEHPC